MLHVLVDRDPVGRNAELGLQRLDQLIGAQRMRLIGLLVQDLCQIQRPQILCGFLALISKSVTLNTFYQRQAHLSKTLDRYVFSSIAGARDHPVSALAS